MLAQGLRIQRPSFSESVELRTRHLNLGSQSKPSKKQWRFVSVQSFGSVFNLRDLLPPDLPEAKRQRA